MTKELKAAFFKEKGFTLIELLVVIAIIGLLATIVTVSLNSARNKAADAAVKANLKTIQTQSEMSYDTNNNYDSVCTDATVVKAVAAVTTAGGVAGVCNDVTGAWASSGYLKSAATYWCVDSVGNWKTEAATLGAGVTVCP